MVLSSPLNPLCGKWSEIRNTCGRAFSLSRSVWKADFMMNVRSRGNGPAEHWADEHFACVYNWKWECLHALWTCGRNRFWISFNSNAQGDPSLHTSALTTSSPSTIGVPLAIAWWPVTISYWFIGIEYWSNIVGQYPTNITSVIMYAVQFDIQTAGTWAKETWKIVLLCSLCAIHRKTALAGSEKILPYDTEHKWFSFHPFL